MENWEQVEMQTLRDYLGRATYFTEMDKDGYYIYRDEDMCLTIKVKPIGDYNYNAIFNNSEPTEGALEVIGDSIIATFQFWYENNDSEMDEIWAEHYANKEKAND